MAACLGRFYQSDFAVRETCADRLDLSGVFTDCGRESHAAWDENSWKWTVGRECQHGGRQPLITSGHPDQAAPERQRSNEAPKYRGCVVTVGQAVHHPRRSLRSPVTRVADEGGKGQTFELIELLGGGPHQQTDFPMTGVIAQRNRVSVFSPNATLSSQNEKLLA